MTLRERATGALMTAARPLLPLLALASRELGRAAAERRGVVGRLEDWSRARRAPDRALLWLHGASAGELAGAAPVVSTLRRERRLQLLVTYFSPSAEPVLGRLSPDVADVLPLDTPRDTRAAVRAVDPDALVFAKGDLWPNLTRAAAGAGVPLGLVNGTVRPGSSRLRPPVRWLLAPAYGRLGRAGAASEADARRLRRLGVPGDALSVTGDAAVDEARDRVRESSASPDGPARRLRSAVVPGLPVVLAGSTWEEDEAALLGAAAELDGRGLRHQLVLVPHEPDADALSRIRRLCRRRLDTVPRLWSELPGKAGTAAGGAAAARTTGDGVPRPVVVDRVGILAGLYPAADVAWVGGGLGGTGLHSVVEPAAAGVPVLHGRRSGRREARELESAGAAAAVGRTEVADALGRVLADPGLRRTMGSAARGWVDSRAGGAAAGARIVADLLDSQDAPASP